MDKEKLIKDINSIIESIEELNKHHYNNTSKYPHLKEINDLLIKQNDFILKELKIILL